MKNYSKNVDINEWKNYSEISYKIDNDSHYHEVRGVRDELYINIECQC